jgi:hypothetical protein
MGEYSHWYAIGLIGLIGAVQITATTPSYSSQVDHSLAIEIASLLSFVIFFVIFILHRLEASTSG